MTTLSARVEARIDGVLVETSAERLADWQCHARPARLGRTCGHGNTGAVRRYGGMQVCEACGCTKFASDARRSR